MNLKTEQREAPCKIAPKENERSPGGGGNRDSSIDREREHPRPPWRSPQSPRITTQKRNTTETELFRYCFSYSPSTALSLNLQRGLLGSRFADGSQYKYISRKTESNSTVGDPWRNGSASDSRSEGCVFDSRRVQNPRT